MMLLKKKDTTLQQKKIMHTNHFLYISYIFHMWKGGGRVSKRGSVISFALRITLRWPFACHIAIGVTAAIFPPGSCCLTNTAPVD